MYPSYHGKRIFLGCFRFVLIIIITDTIYKHLLEHNILAKQQKGCRKCNQGCKVQLTIDSVNINDVFNKNNDIYVY